MAGMGMRFALTLVTVMILVLLSFVIKGRVANAKDPKAPTGPIAKIKILAGGVITYDGSKVDLDKVRARLEKLKKADGAVWYYRESTDKEAEQTGEKIIKIIIQVKIPVRLMEDQPATK